jgi:NAD(P)-dependent dehydrogenase (short-subunit alcohol dehydrogenase family)
MNKRLDGKVVVITGGAGLLGVEHARAVLENGGRVALLDIDIDALAKAQNLLDHDFPGVTMALACDIASESDVQRCLKEICSRFSTPTGLVNNAAINPSVEKNTDRFSRLEDLMQADWDLELGVGLWGSFVCSKVFGLAMIKDKIRGSIVNISSDHGIMAPNQSLYRLPGIPEKQQPVKPVTYSVVKHGLVGLTRYLATYWAADEIRVNTLCPGGVLNGQSEEFLERFNALVPLGRPAHPHEYRGSIVYLLSDESTYMTGSIMVVDGGRSVW